jgi:hypothetical protein
MGAVLYIQNIPGSLLPASDHCNLELTPEKGKIKQIEVSSFSQVRTGINTAEKGLILRFKKNITKRA